MSPLFWVVLFLVAIVALLIMAFVSLLDEPYGPTRKQRRQWKRERADTSRVRR